MPGLWGFAKDSPSDDDLSLFAAMGDRLGHHAPCLVREHHEDGPPVHLGRVSLGFLDDDDRPASNEDGSLVVMLEGEVYDVPALRRPLEAAGHRFRGRGQAELLLHGYEQEGRAFFRRLNGAFVAAIWDANRGRLSLACDRFGMKPLYYAAPPGRLLFAPEIKALLADGEVSRAPSLRGIAQFLTFGQLLGEDTMLEAVSILPAAGWLDFDPRSGRLEVGRYWRPRSAVPGRTPAAGEAFDRLGEAFQRSVDRRVAGPGRLGISLSGGLDSRMILAAIDTGRTPVSAVSLGMEGSIDVEAARRMCAHKGCGFHRLQLGRDFIRRFEEYLDRTARATDGHYLSQCLTAPGLPDYRDLGIEVLLRGHAGELMHMDKAYSFSLDRAAFAIRDEAGLEAWLAARLPAFLLGPLGGSLFAAPIREQMEAHARDSLRGCIAESRHVDPPAHRIWHMFLAQRLRRETSLSMAEFGSVVETRLPFLDNDLVDLYFETPPGLKLGDAFAAHFLARRCPEFLAIPNANTGARIGAGRVERSLSRFRLRALAKLRIGNNQPYERLGLWLRQDLAPLVGRLLLSDRCLDRGILDPGTIRAVVADHASGRRNHTFLILALMIFEHGRSTLFDAPGAMPGERAGARHPEGVGLGRA